MFYLVLLLCSATNINNCNQVTMPGEPYATEADCRADGAAMLLKPTESKATQLEHNYSLQQRITDYICLERKQK